MSLDKVSAFRLNRCAWDSHQAGSRFGKKFIIQVNHFKNAQSNSFFIEDGKNGNAGKGKILHLPLTGFTKLRITLAGKLLMPAWILINSKSLYFLL